MDINLLLEAEKRGILSPEKQSLLNEARSRGLIPPRGGVSTNSEAISEFTGKTRSFFEGLKSGGSYSLADEGVGALSAALGIEPKQNVGKNDTFKKKAFDYSGKFSDRYVKARDEVRNQQAAAQKSNPSLYGAGQVGGAVIQAAASAPYATGKTLLETMARGAGLGGLEGSVFGFGRGEGAAESGKTAVKDGILGIGLGATATALVSGGKALYRSFADPITGAMNVGNSGRARRAVAATVNKSGQSLDDITQKVTRAAREGQPEFRTMDALGLAGARRANGIARAGGESGDEIAEYLAQRQLDQGDRVAGFVDDAFDLGGGSAEKVKGTLKAGRKETADRAYDAARGNAAPVDIRPVVSAIDDRIGGMQGVDIAGDSIDAKFLGFRKRLTAGKTPEGVDSIELSDFDRVLGVKQDVQDAIGAAVRANKNNAARELRKLETALDKALEDSSDMYRAANDGFREASRVIDAIDSGADMTKRTRRAIDTVDEFGRLTPDQQAAARVGYGDRALAQIEANPSPTANKAKPFQSTKASAEADAIAIDPKIFRDRMARETQMWETQNRALGGSRTADNLAEMDGASNVASDAGGFLKSAANFQLGDAAEKMIRMIAPALSGQNEATRKLIAKALMSSDPKAMLGPALTKQVEEMLRQRMVESMLRNAARQNTEFPF